MDLAEVEAVLSQHPGVAAAAAKLWQLPAGPVLATYVQLAGQPANRGSADGSPATAPAISGSELQQWCKERLPAAAVPQHVLVLPHLPRSAAGKVQRSQLPHPLATAAEAGAEAAAAEAPAAAAADNPFNGAARHGDPASKRPRTDSTAPATTASPLPAAAQPISELTVSRAFAAALGHSEFEATTNLFSIGGNSLMAAQIAGRVAGGDVEAVFSHPTVRSLAAFLAGRPGAAEAAGMAAAAGSRGSQDRGKQPGLPEAALLHARQLDLSGSPQQPAQQQAVQPGRPQLRLAWRAKMLQCVDAAPVFEPAAGSGQQAASSCVVACSHGGDVCCYEADSGKQLWSTVLQDRTDAGLVVCGSQPSCSMQSSGGDVADQQQQAQQQQQQQQQQDAQQTAQQQQQQQQYVAVATNGGTLAFLCAADGSLAGSLECGGGIRAPPVIDPWCGLVWQPTHSRPLVVAAAPGRAVAQLALPAAVSAAVTFCAELRLAFVCCLDGSLVTVTVDVVQLAAVAALPAAAAETPGDPAGLCSSSSGADGSCALALAWQHRSSAPLFAPAAPLPGGSIAVAAVDGSVTCLSFRDGSQLWRAAVQGAVFAPMLVLLSSTGPAALLVGTQTGQLAALDPATGRQLGALQLGGKITGMQLLPLQRTATADGSAAELARQAQPLLAVTLACGIVAVLDAHAWLGGSNAAPQDCCVVDAVQLPADVFAPPAVSSGAGAGVGIAAGCRDDHLYCFHLR